MLVPEQIERVTPRQLQVLGYICSGMSYAETARSLGISIHTVHNHIKHLREILSARSNAHVVALLWQASRYYLMGRN